MKHYEVGEWADFVRNLVSESKRIEMEQHQAGCSECAGQVEFLRGVAVAAQTENAYDSQTEQLAASARRAFVKQESPASTRDRVIHALQTLVAYLTYDSDADLRPAGARTLKSASRQMLYEAGDFCVDLRFDEEPDSMQMTVVGQVATRQEAGYSRYGLPVVILSSNKVIAKTTSNQFGEFSLDYVPAPGLRLCVSVAQAGISLEIPLNAGSNAYED